MASTLGINRHVYINLQLGIQCSSGYLVVLSRPVYQCMAGVKDVGVFLQVRLRKQAYQPSKVPLGPVPLRAQEVYGPNQRPILIKTFVFVKSSPEINLNSPLATRPSKTANPHWLSPSKLHEALHRAIQNL